MSKSNTKIKANYRVIGVMSGTSLDGLDLALVDFNKKDEKWSFDVIETLTQPYSHRLTQQLTKATQLSASQLNELDKELGRVIGQSILNHFAADQSIDFIASHGHTIFHQPQKCISLQIGKAEVIHQLTGLPIISDFRSLDVALGGNGAPLVPIGDQTLFSNYDCFLNLGGIANGTLYNKGIVEAYDIMPFNMVFNHLAKKLNLNYDKDGLKSRSGSLDEKLFSQFEALDYYQKPHPKSLGFEDFEKVWLPLIEKADSSIEDQMHSYALHAAKTIATEFNVNAGKESKLLITGGGAYHAFFIEQLQEQFLGEVVVPLAEIVEFKEAIIFGLLGVLKFENKNNCLSSVTGASQDSSSGMMLGF